MTTDAAIAAVSPTRLSRREGMGLAVAFAVSAILAVLATAFALSGLNEAGPASDVLFGMLGLSLAGALAIAVLLTQRIVRIARARNAPDAGARLHLRFVALFSFAAALPAIVVAIFLGLMMSRGVDRWFSERFEAMAEHGGALGRVYVDTAVEDLRGEFRAMALDLNGAASGLTTHPERYQAYLTAQARQRLLEGALVVNRAGEVLSAADVGRGGMAPPRPEMFVEADAGEAPIDLFEQESLVRALVRLDAYDDAYLYVARTLDPDVLQNLRSFESAVIAYRELRERRGRLHTLFMLAYLDMALLVLLGAVWLGLSNATRLSEPIGRLAEAAGRVAAGDLSARVPVGSERGDEVDALATGFNRMTAQLSSQREDLVNARREAEERSRFIQTVLSNVSAGVVSLDAAGRVTAANDSAAELLSVEAGTLEGRRLVDIAPELNEMLDLLQVSPDRRAERLDLQRNGATRHLSVRVSGAPDGGLVLTFDDMTRLISAQRQEAWKDVARRIAHEIKNPLTPIQLSAERLMRKYGAEIQSDPETFRSCGETILRQVADIGRMVDEFSGFARMPAPEKSWVDIVDLAREAIFSYRLGHSDIRFDLDAAETSIPFYSDGRLVLQALTNLLKNASEAIQARRARDDGEPAAGYVVLSIRAEPPGLAIEVSDNGIGFPAADRDRLVEPYVTTRAKGTGLGLAIVRRIVEDHSGTLSLSDSPLPGGGAQVRILLPIVQPAEVAAASERFS